MHTNVFHCFWFVYFENLEITQTPIRIPNNINGKPHRKATNSNKMHAYRVLAYSGLEQPRPGLAKFIYFLRLTERSSNRVMEEKSPPAVWRHQFNPRK